MVSAMSRLSPQWLIPLAAFGVFYVGAAIKNIYGDATSKNSITPADSQSQAESLKKRQQLLKEREDRLAGTNPASGLSPQEQQTQRESRAQGVSAQAGQSAIDQLRSEGWFEVQNGIYARWCADSCPATQAYMDYAWRLEVWCKERACGDIYARINIQDGASGPVVGWTNDSGYGDIGQKVILTFQSATNGNASITEFRARG